MMIVGMKIGSLLIVMSSGEPGNEVKYVYTSDL